MRAARSFLIAGLAALAAACASTPPAILPGPSSPPPVEPTPPTADAITLDRLPGWDQENHLAAFDAYRIGCRADRSEAGRAVCEAAQALASRGPVSPSAARQFFETRFLAVSGGEPGLLTSYFAPEYPARRARTGDFSAPVMARPSDLQVIGDRDGRPLYGRRLADGTTQPYPDRAGIDAGGASAEILGWMKAEDLFFMQIQGSGYLSFEDGGHARAAYAADNGHPFVGIARPMVQRGLLPENGTSSEAIRRWLADHRGVQAAEVMALNPRYIFFRSDPDDGGDPAGAAGIPLPARRAIAIDPGHWRYGQAVWIEGDGGNLVGARASYRGLVMALDTGSAIRGPVRADLYMGRGQAAGDEAGTVRHPLRMWRLVAR